MRTALSVAWVAFLRPMASRDLKELPALPLRRLPESASSAVVEGRRRDGRTLDALRPLFLKIGLISKAAGSAYMELGRTKVLCSVFGPHTVNDGREYLQRGQLECTLRFASFAQRARRRPVAGGSPDERELSAALSAALAASVQLEQYPKQMLAVQVIVVEDDGGALPTAISCASLALADASVLQYDLVAACGAAALEGWKEGGLALDPTAPELGGASGGVVAAQMPSLSQVTLVRHQGGADFAAGVAGIQLALAGSAQLHELMLTELRARAATKLKAGAKGAS